MTAKEWVERIEENIEGYHADRITYQEFDRLQKEAWSTIEEDAALKDDVLAILRKRLP